MNGFIASQVRGLQKKCRHLNDPGCTVQVPGGKVPYDVVGWHDAREIPNYWSYAHNFVLQDHMFEGVGRGACRPIWTWCRDGAPRAPGPPTP
jgi:phospholipase C